MTAPSTDEMDLAQCAQEPIHIPGGIQPHGTLLVLDPRTLEVIQQSRNAAEVLGPARPIDRKLTGEWERAGLIEQLQRWIDSAEPSLQRTTTIAGRVFQVLGHRTAQGVLLEFEPPPESERDTLDALYPRIARYIEDLQSTINLTQLCQCAAQFFSGDHGLRSSFDLSIRSGLAR